MKSSHRIRYVRNKKEKKLFLIIESIIKYVPIITALFIVLECCKIIHYYQQWNFDVTAYLSISYILTQFVGDISTAITIIIVAFGLISIVFLIEDGADTIYFLINLMLPMGIFTLLYLLTNYIVKDQNISMAFSTGITVFLTFAFFPFTRRNSKKVKEDLKEGDQQQAIKEMVEEKIKQVEEDYSKGIRYVPVKERKPIEYRLIVAVIAMFILTGFSNNKYTYNDLIKGGLHRQTIIKLKSGEVINKYENQYFIGQTENHVFTYSDSTHAVRAISKEDVKELISVSFRHQIF